MAILRWCQQTGVEWHYIAPGKPTQNAFVESFNGWPAGGFVDTEIRCFMKPEVAYAAKTFWG